MTLWIQNPTVSYRSAFGIGSSPSSQDTTEICFYPQATPEALPFFYCHRLRVGNQDFASRKNARVSHKQVSRASSKKRVQAPDPGNATLSAPPVDYEFHPDIQRTERRRVREGACHSTASNPVRNLKGGIQLEGL
jgi:hypothetical protein